MNKDLTGLFRQKRKRFIMYISSLSLQFILMIVLIGISGIAIIYTLAWGNDGMHGKKSNSSLGAVSVLITAVLVIFTVLFMADTFKKHVNTDYTAPVIASEKDETEQIPSDDTNYKELYEDLLNEKAYKELYEDLLAEQNKRPK